MNVGAKWDEATVRMVGPGSRRLQLAWTGEGVGLGIESLSPTVFSQFSGGATAAIRADFNPTSSVALAMACVRCRSMPQVWLR